MSALFLELDRTVLFLSFPFAPHGKGLKALPVMSFETKKLLVSVDAVVGIELLATNHADRHMGTVLTNYVLVRRLQRLESHVTYITGVNLHSLV